MPFADMKNDFVFRRIFGKHPDILRGLLNDLLDRRGERAIEDVTYLPESQLPLVEGAKLSILDVRCRDRSGVTFIVEIQQACDFGEGKRAEGKVEAEAEAILTVLAARGIAVGDDLRAHIADCRDGETLDRWLARAVVAPSAADVVAAETGCV